MSFDQSLSNNYHNQTHISHRLNPDFSYVPNQHHPSNYPHNPSLTSLNPNYPSDHINVSRLGDKPFLLSYGNEGTPRHYREPSTHSMSPRNRLLYPASYQPSPQPNMGYPSNNNLIRAPTFRTPSKPIYSGFTPKTQNSLAPFNFEHVQPMNFDHIPSFNNIPQYSLGARRHTHESEADLMSMYQPKLERIVERQNQLLSRFLDKISLQKQQEHRQHNAELAQELRELEERTLKTDLELARQNMRMFSKEREEAKAPRKEKSVESEKPNLKDALYGVVIKKIFTKNAKSVILRKKNLSEDQTTLKPIKLKDEEDNESIEYEEPTKSKTHHRIISDNITFTRQDSRFKTPIDNEDYSNRRESLPNVGVASRTRELEDKGRELVKKRIAKSKMPSLLNLQLVEDSQQSLTERTPKKSPRQYMGTTPNEDYFDIQRSIRVIKDERTPKSQRYANTERIIEVVDSDEEEVQETIPVRGKLKKMKSKKFTKQKSIKGISMEKEEEDQEAIQAREKLLNEKAMRKKVAYERVKSFGWAITYCRLLYDDRKKSTLARREVFEKNASESLTLVYDGLKSYVVQFAGKEILDMLKNTNFKFILTCEYNNPEKKLEKDCIALMGHFKTILNKLVINLSNLPHQAVKVLSDLTQENHFMPNDYLTSFELKRLRFGGFGTTVEMNSSRVKMILGGFLIIRVLIYYAFMHPWETFKTTKKSFQMEKILNISSVLYNITMDIFKNTVPASSNNMSSLSVDLKVKPKKKIFEAISDKTFEKAHKVLKESSRDGEIIEGFYAKKQILSFFNNKSLVDELTRSTQGFLDALYQNIAKPKKNVDIVENVNKGK